MRTVTSAGIALLLLVAGACGVMLLSGCEDDDPDFDITPDTVVVDASTRTNLQLVVSGGTPPYRWENTNPGLGTLAAAGDTGFYSSRPVAGQNSVSVTDAGGAVAIARIEQM